MEELRRYEPGRLLDLQVFSGFCGALQQACGDLQRQVAALQGETAALRGDVAATTRQLHTERRGRLHAAQHIVQLMVAEQRRALRRNAFAALRQHAARATRLRRASRALAYRTRLTTYRCLTRFAAARQERRVLQADRANGARRGAQQRILGRYYTTLRNYHASGVEHRRREALARTLMIGNGKGIRYRFLARWRQFVNTRRAQARRRASQRAQLGLFERSSWRAGVRGWYLQWTRWADAAGRRRQREDLLSKVAELTMRHEYELRQYSEGRFEDVVSLCEGLSGEVAAAGKKQEMLGSQVDITLTSLSNTNGVLNKMVDRLLRVDELLDALHREKADKTEGRPLATKAPLPVAAHDPQLRTAAGNPPQAPAHSAHPSIDCYSTASTFMGHSAPAAAGIGGDATLRPPLPDAAAPRASPLPPTGGLTSTADAVARRPSLGAHERPSAPRGGPAAFSVGSAPPRVSGAAQDLDRMLRHLEVRQGRADTRLG
eukprot:TRINITY_DN14943_c0_g1_i1.p1 TRINITY_DN14943_c0_g1~~TRINITY_DN14943_c0_g1_i1.p1  ORF type:complete len:490 (+),score=93.55 TRINITY_DN14943_c0_g1_i1:71-1540(+)